MAKIAKCLIAAGGAFVGALGQAAYKNGGTLTWADAITALGAAAVLGYGVWQTPNAPA